MGLFLKQNKKPYKSTADFVKIFKAFLALASKK